MPGRASMRARVAAGNARKATRGWLRLRKTKTIVRDRARKGRSGGVADNVEELIHAP